MGYVRAEEILPKDIIELIQRYVDGQNIYIPRKDNSREDWGTHTNIRNELCVRNHHIYLDFLSGRKVKELSERYCLSEKSIQRIIRDQKKNER